MIEPEPGLPDLVFTANAAVVLDRKAVLARFFHPERQREQPVLAAGFRALQARGLLDEIVEMPAGVTLEGAGDCIWDRCARLILDGLRLSLRCRRATAIVDDQFGVPCLPLATFRSELLSPRHRHSARCRSGDVALLSGSVHAGSARTASTSTSRRAQRIELDSADAARFAANAVCLDRTVVMSGCSDGAAARAGRARLQSRQDAVAGFPAQRRLGLLSDVAPRSQNAGGAQNRHDGGVTSAP